MTFKIINAREDKSEVLVSGYLVGDTQDESELLQIISEEFKKIKTYNDKVTIKNKHLVFKGVTFGLLKQTLGYLAKTLDFELKYIIGKEFKGDTKIKTLIESSI